MTASQQFPEVVAREYDYIPDYIGEFTEDTTLRETVSVRGALLAKANKDMLAFTQYTFPQYKADEYHKNVAGHLNDVVLGDTMNLMLFAPPQTGKSELVSTRLPSYWLAKNPELPVALVSYGASLAYRNSRYAKSVFESPQYREIFPHMMRDTSNWRMHDWHILDEKGYVLAAGVGGPLTGHGFGLGIIDDPIENWAAGQSEVLRESVWQWWLGTFKTRMWENGRIVFMMCMPGDMRIMMGDGTWRNLDTIRPGELVMTKDGRELKPQIVEAFLPQGIATIYEIKTGNHKISATGNHPLLVRVARSPDELEWVRTDELEIGDEICVLGQWDGGENTRKLKREDAVVLGFMFGDGWITHHPNKKGAMRWVTCFARGGNEETNQRILNYYKNRFDIRPNYKEKPRYYRTEVARVGRWFESLGLWGKAKTKRVPDFIFQSTLDIRKAFIEGFVLADGSIDKCNRATILINNQLLAKDLKLLAESCGYKTSNINRQSGIYQPPGSPEPIRATSYRFSFSLVNTDNDIFVFKKIRSIKKSIQRPVYDLTVKDTHNFIAEGAVVHNTRWHEDDLAGRILKQEGRIEEGGKWTVISYPALADHKDGLDSLGREVGDALAPSRYSREYLLTLRDELGPHVWSAEFQQKPTKPEGDLFKIGRIQLVNAVPAEIADVVLPDPSDRFPEPFPEIRQVFMGTRAWDLAGSTKKTQKQDPDYTVGFLIAVFEGNVYMLDMVREQMTPDQAEQMVRITAGTDGKRVRVRVEKEPGQAGLYQVNNYIKMLMGYDVDGVPATGDKMVRASPLASQVNAGNVFMLRAVWNKFALNELAGFPNAAHDDIVDSAAYAFNDQTTGEVWARMSFKSI